MSTFVSIGQIAKRARKHPKSVKRAMKAAGVLPPLVKGVHGHRVELQVANSFIAKQWPEVRPIRREELYETTEKQPTK